jgi:hypothetical protein
MEKNKKLIVLGVLALILIVSGITYAILTWTSSRVNIGLTSNCFTIDYTKGQDITNQSIKLINEKDLISDGKFTIKDGIALTYANIGIKSTCTIEGYGILKLNVTSLSDAFTTGNSKGSLKYAVLKNTSTTSTITVTSLLNQSFDLVTRGSITKLGTIDILTEQLSNNEIYKYLIVVYIDNSLVDNDVIGSSFAGNISAEAYQGKLGADYTLQRLHSLNSSIVLDTSKTPDFSTVSGNNGVKKNLQNNSTIASNQGDGTKGIYSAEDDFGTSYYFRGTVENNYVKFANKYWRIIRINGDGSIRMIYAGTSAHANGTTYNDMKIDNSEYNTNYNDNTYVGYKIGSTGSSTYANTHSNAGNSTIKTYIDNWYETNLKEYKYYLKDTIYCNDRKVVNINNVGGMTLTGDGTGTNESAYAGFDRTYVSHSPTLKCENKNDRFTVNNTMGNMELVYPIALATSDELVYAGATGIDPATMTYITNTEFYLFNGNFCWTMTPFVFAGGYANVDFFGDFGGVGSDSVNNGISVLPVVSLRSDAILGGSGTMNDPFVVE